MRVAPENVSANDAAEAPRHLIALRDGLPFTLRFEARCKLCAFTTGIDVELHDQSGAAESIAVAAVLHNDAVHAKRPAPKEAKARRR